MPCPCSRLPAVQVSGYSHAMAYPMGSCLQAPGGLTLARWHCLPWVYVECLRAAYRQAGEYRYGTLEGPIWAYHATGRVARGNVYILRECVT